MEGQSYKIYFNEGALVIADSPDALRGLPNLFYIDDDEIHKSFNILTSNVSTGRVLNYGLVSMNPDEVFREFLDSYTVIQAAGGLVLNKETQLPKSN